MRWFVVDVVVSIAEVVVLAAHTPGWLVGGVVGECDEIDAMSFGGGFEVVRENWQFTALKPHIAVSPCLCF